MPRVLLVNNYYSPEKVLPLKEELSSAGASVTMIEREMCSPSAFSRQDGVVLSGSPAMLSEPGAGERFGAEIEAIRGSRTPLLGICFGHQLIGIAHGSRVIKAPETTRRYVETEVLTEDGLFAGLPRRISVYESHAEIVENVPERFVLTARSPTSPIAAYRHEREPIHGVQFHPEKNSAARPDGRVFVENFVKSLD